MTSHEMDRSAWMRNPRRPPAHLSVSLKQRSKGLASRQLKSRRGEGSPFTGRETSSTSDESGGLKGWFESSNKQPAAAIPNFPDNDPPYYLPHGSSNESNEALEPNQRPPPYANGLTQHALFPAENDSSADDYRSVIDDLTIENKGLKKQIRRLKAMEDVSLENDNLFEIRIHQSLPSLEKRKLIDCFEAFVASRSGLSDTPSSTSISKLTRPFLPTSGDDSKHLSSSSTSNSRPGDSGYASMSNSGPTSISALHEANLQGKSKAVPDIFKDQKIQSFLHDIPEGLMPQHPTVMTERQKKMLVVRRLEQIFTGKATGIVKDHPLQQQEISKSAARSSGRTETLKPEGLREAHILPHTMDVDQVAPRDAREPGQNTASPDLLDSAGSGTPSSEGSPSQRPTRPLDLDPDREQNPVDNLEYLRHLGLSGTQLLKEESSDAEPDAEGWVYLNLLINMAQLHIVNVTPAFVRSAVSDLSTKFQLSADGKRIRWRGGTDGTHMSSDGGSPSDDRNQESSDSMGGTLQKRRKLNPIHGRSAGRFATMPMEAGKGNVSAATTPAQSTFHYTPLFHHRDSDDDSISVDESSNLESSPTGYSGDISPVESSNRRRPAAERIVFYSGAPFCTDLSSDCTHIDSLLQLAGSGKANYSDHTDNALGCIPRRPDHTFGRTSSGSLLLSRPFRDSYGIKNTIATRSPTPELIDDSTDEDHDMDLLSDWPLNSNSGLQSPQSPTVLEFSASGVGGTQPADHFVTTVLTRRTILVVGERRKKVHFTPSHNISKASLDVFRDTKNRQIADEITERLASLAAFSASEPKNTSTKEPPVKSEILSCQVLHLKPSELPEPAGYYAATSSSDDSGYTESTSSDQDIRKPASYRRPMTQLSNPDAPSPYAEMSLGEGWTEEDENDNVDMSAAASRDASENGAEGEQEFAMDVDSRIGPELQATSSAAAVDSESGYSPEQSSEE